MRFEHFVGLRYLMAKRQRDVLSVITLISIGGVAVGVMALIVVLSVMGGFEGDLREKIIGAKAHIVVSHEDGYLSDYGAVLAALGGVKEVEGASPYVEGEVMINSATNLQGVILRGIDPVRVRTVSNLGEVIQEGSLDYLSDPKALPALSSRPWTQAQQRTVVVQQDEEGGELSQDRLDALLASGAKATLSFVGAAHGTWLRERDGSQPTPGQAEDVLGTEVDAGPGAAEVDGVAEAEVEAEVESAESEGDLWHAQLPLQEAGEGERAVDAVMEPVVSRRRVMQPIPGLDEGDGGAERKVGGLLVGKELRSNLNVFVGHEVNVMSPTGDVGPTGGLPKSRPFKVVGVFFSGMYEYDTKFAYVTLEDAQHLLNIGDRVSGIEIKITDLRQSAKVKAAIESLLSAHPGIKVQDWRELNGSLFSALLLEKIAMFVILTSIILVASFNILCLLIMIVIEKGREIAIFKSMGASRGSIMRIFVVQGAVIGSLGTAIGCGLGLALCWLIGGWGIKPPGDVYYLSHIPVEVRPFEVLLICGAAIVISLLATVLPSIMAARLDPVEGLRYE